MDGPILEGQVPHLIGPVLATQLFNAWNTTVKLSRNCPRDTRTYLVQQVLSCSQSTARTDILTRYSKFFNSLRPSTSKEVATMANIASRDIQTTTGRNLRLVERASGLSAWGAGGDKLKEAIKTLETVQVELVNKWRVPLLDKLLSQRQELVYCGEDTEVISDQINSLCIN